MAHIAGFLRSIVLSPVEWINDRICQRTPTVAPDSQPNHGPSASHPAWKAGVRGVVLAVPLLGVNAGEPTVAPPSDVAPRSIFVSSQADFLFGRIYCHRTFCKKYTGAFPDTRIWTHTTNITRPPRPLWLWICARNTAGDFVYRHVVLRPGQTHWVINRIPRGHWGWISTWVVDPFPVFQPLQLTQNTGVIDPLLGRFHENTATIQFATPGVFGISESVRASPADTSPWGIDTTFSEIPGQSVTFEDWNSLVDPLVDQQITTTVTATPDGFEQLVEFDLDEDGLVDETTLLVLAQSDSGMSMELRVHNSLGDVIHSQEVLKTTSPGLETIVTQIDEDGDGVIDIVETETATTVGSTTTIEIQRDLGGDGSVDETESTTLNTIGDLSSTQSTEIRNAFGSLVERIDVTLSPTPDGYSIETLHDEDGDGVFDSRELQQSQVGPFGSGTDVDRFQIDDGADGTFDSDNLVTTTKTLTGTVYIEIVDVDSDANGLVDATSQRDVVLGAAAPPEVPDGSGGTTPMRIDKLEVGGSTLSVFYDAATCPALGHNLIFGTEAQLPAAAGGLYGLSGSVCNVGNSSPFVWTSTPVPSAGTFVWWVMVTDNGDLDVKVEGAWGTDSAGNQRDGAGMNGASGECGTSDKNVSNSCP